MHLDEFRELHRLRESARRVSPHQSKRLGAESGLRTLGTAPVLNAVFGRPPKDTNDLGCNTYLWVIDPGGISFLIAKPLETLDGQLPKHTNLTGGGPAYVGGEFWFIDTSTLYISGGSGRFPPMNEEQLDAAISVFESFGYAVTSLGWNPVTDRARRFLEEL